MNWKSILVYLLLLAVAFAFSVLIGRCTPKPVIGPHDALKKAGEFLQPDTASDLRFGHNSKP